MFEINEREVHKARLNTQLFILAEKRASTYAPPPTYTPAQAGIVGCLLGLIALPLVSRTFGVELDYFSLTSTVNLAAFAALPTTYVAHLRVKHHEAVKQETSRLEAERTALDN